MSTVTDSTKTPTTKGGKPRLSDRAKAEQRLGWKLAMPAFVVMLLVTAYPILQAVWNSFFNYRLTDPANKEFVGLNNYIVSFSDSVFWSAMWATVIITVITVVVELVLGFIIALVMHRIVLPRRTLRTVVLIPYSIITVVSGFTWLFMYQTDTGFVNRWTNWIPGVSDNYDWFGSFWPSIFAISVSEIWKTTPFISLLLLAGLAQVDSSMEEAAKVDGASWWQVLIKVILPSMKAAVMVALLFRTLDAFRIFDNIFIMTGGANDTSSLSMLIYR